MMTSLMMSVSGRTSRLLPRSWQLHPVTALIQRATQRTRLWQDASRLHCHAD
ncbi:hypothetical protein DPMN_144831 [Dreissena polymorpha]|uniref:Uncharacterized protein n=1 Tax=Dreissena polymorpha TaxID=45954 RepID=A0A9D4F3V8_DREPO|nr:hypothetical protein DPMN_144831 [Dreissena polymorpha]